VADIRCPMCSQLNPEGAEVCAFCSARLRPLLAGGPSADAEAGEPESGEADWLSRIRSEAVRGEPSGEPPPAEEGAPDWLSRLRRAEAEEEGPPVGEVPTWVSEAVEPAAPAPAEVAPAAAPDVPDWLARVRERKAAEGVEAPEPAPESTDDDWLGRLRAPQEEQAPAREAPTLPEILRPPPEVAPAVKPTPGSLPSWLPQPPAAEEEAADVSPPLPSTPWEPPSRPIATPFSRGPVAPPPAPAWPPAPETPAVSGPPDWAQAAPELAQPAELEGLAHVPALLPEEGTPFLPGESGDFDLDSVHLPEWLSEVKAPAAPSKPPTEEQGINLAPATLPAWLEAMRPMETFRPVVEIQPEEEQMVEAAGPLAGLRGVLLAEPVMAMPRQTDIGSTRLDVTERQYAHAEFLHRMVQEEERELPPAAAARRRIPLTRWILSLVLLVAVALPMTVGLPAFAVPILGPPDLNPFIGRINTLPTDRPVLLVVDYEPGYSGELESVAGPMLDHMVARGLRIATVSTRPSGPPLAERLLVRAGVDAGYQNGRDYLHLGYLPGGPAAVQLFAENPRQAVPRGYLIPAELTSRSGWESPMLSGVSALRDFGAVILITSGAETARTWIEQASPRLGDVPLLMVLSAGVEPMVRPYYETLNPQVDAILAGLPAAAAYENANGRPGGAQSIWGGFGSGVFVAEITLALGAGYGLLTALLSRRRA